MEYPEYTIGIALALKRLLKVTQLLFVLYQNKHLMLDGKYLVWYVGYPVHDYRPWQTTKINSIK